MRDWTEMLDEMERDYWKPKIEDAELGFPADRDPDRLSRTNADLMGDSIKKRGIIRAGGEREFVLLVLKKHRNPVKMRGIITNIWISKAPNGGHCFYASFDDGEIADISWHDCLYPGTHHQAILNAMRAAINPQVQEYRRKIWPDGMPCPDVDIHHAEEAFKQISENFLKENQQEIKIVYDGRNTPGRFEDRELEQKWMAYHAEHFHPEALSKEDHKKLRKRSILDAFAGMPEKKPEPVQKWDVDELFGFPTKKWIERYQERQKWYASINK
ncbi:MAG TPA: hypothetical protein VMD05_07955 [Candidatus Nanoarchaeia archaeon]|nr:hypothetical protein [Candidatus Nanoarchaeia archaeon]